MTQTQTNPASTAATSTSFGEKISFTADVVAFARTSTDIPLCPEIFDIAEKIGAPLDPKEKARTNEEPHIIPYMEARYKLTDRLLENSGYTQVIELASGLSPRGFIACDDPYVQYVEIDLPEKMFLKRKIVDELHRRQGTGRYSNLHLEEGNVINTNDMEATETYFSRDPVFIVCEGLLRYLSFADKEKLAKNVRRIMEQHPGSIWTTPDIHLLCDVENLTTTTRWGVDVKPNMFRDIHHAREFFRGFGFLIEERSLAEMFDRLVTPKRFNMDERDVRTALEKRTVFVMTL